MALALRWRRFLARQSLPDGLAAFCGFARRGGGAGLLGCRRCSRCDLPPVAPALHAAALAAGSIRSRPGAARACCAAEEAMIQAENAA
jgi:hypothetical protein